MTLGGWLINHQSWQQTVQIMSTLRDEWKKSVEVRGIVADIVRGIPQDSPAAVADAVYQYIRSRVRYTPDVNGVETLQAPMVTLQLGIGDCDDMALLAATLLEAAGYATGWWLLGYTTTDAPEHIAVYMPVTGGYAACVDCTINTFVEKSPLLGAKFNKIL